MAHLGDGSAHKVVDLVSDSDSDSLPDLDLNWFDAQEFGQDFPDLDDPLADFRERSGTHERETIDLTAIPDMDVPPSDLPIASDEDAEPTAGASGWDEAARLITEAACLQMVLGVLPDISIDHVLKIISEKTTDATRTVAQCEQVITELLDGEAYPKEADELRHKKRKREDDDDWGDYEKGERGFEIDNYEQQALNLLKDEFLSVPVRHLINVLKEQKTLFKAFGILEEQVRNYQKVATPFSKIGKARNERGTELSYIEQGSQLPKEMHAAKKRSVVEAAKRREAEEAQQAEEANLQQAQMNNRMGECACCFNDVPNNRMISCSGDPAHSYCLECPRQQIETQMGQSRCRPKCFAVVDCDGTFSRSQLQQLLSEKTFERLEHMQQMDDLQQAGLDFLSECPFCDFKMECPPVEIDKEFRCQNSKCGRTSCRLCDKESHIPLSCEEAKKDGQLTMRHVVEEAMSDALIRHCNQCKHPFVKEMGCNKMTCTHCRNVQCYVCSKNVTSYDHFGEERRGKCPLHENVEDRHEQEVKKAADEAMAKVRADNPGLSEADLMIKVSDRVKHAENARKSRAAANVDAFPYHMMDGRLAHRVPGVGAQAAFPPPPPPPQMPVVPQLAAQYVHPYPAPVPAPVFFHPVQPMQYPPPAGFFGPAPPQHPFAPLQALLNMIPGRARRPDGNAINMQPDRRVPPARDQIEGQMDHIRRQQEERNRMRRDRDRAHAEAAMQRANHLQAQALQLANRVNQQRLGLQHLQQGAENNRRIAEWQMQQIQQARRAVGPRGPQR